MNELYGQKRLGIDYIFIAKVVLTTCFDLTTLIKCDHPKSQHLFSANSLSIITLSKIIDAEKTQI